FPSRGWARRWTRTRRPAWSAGGNVRPAGRARTRSRWSAPHRQRERHADAQSAAAGAFAGAEARTVAGGDPRHQGQADAAAALAIAGAPTEEPLEDAFALVGRHAGTIVAHAQQGVAVLDAAVDLDARALAGIAHRVVDQ